MPLTLADCRSSLARYAGSGNDFVARLNEVRARYIQGGSWKGTKQLIPLHVYADADGNSIVTLPRKFDTILAGAVTSTNSPLCGGWPMGVRNEFSEFDPNGLGYNGLTGNFQEVSGRFAVYQEWTGGMFIALRFETTEDAGVVHLSGAMDGSDVYSLYSGAWIKGEKVAYTGTGTFTSTKKFEAKGFSAVKPVTKGRVFVSAVDSNGTATEVAVWEPGETLPKRRRYKVLPVQPDTAPVTGISTAAQSYTPSEFDALFSGSDVLNVSGSGVTQLAPQSFFLRVVKIIAGAGSGAYTAQFALPTTNAKSGATFRVKLEIAASANPTLQFYSGSTSGTLLRQVFGDSSNATYATLEFSYNGSGWEFDA